MRLFLRTVRIVSAVCVAATAPAQDAPIAPHTAASPIGVWMLSNDATCQFSFSKNGTFEYKAPAYNASSKGRFETGEGWITLFYTEIDGVKVEGSPKMKVGFTGDTAFKINNRFTFVRKN